MFSISVKDCKTGENGEKLDGHISNKEFDVQKKLGCI